MSDRPPSLAAYYLAQIRADLAAKKQERANENEPEPEPIEEASV